MKMAESSGQHRVEATKLFKALTVLLPEDIMSMDVDTHTLNEKLCETGLYPPPGERGNKSLFVSIVQDLLTGNIQISNTSVVVPLGSLRERKEIMVAATSFKVWYTLDEIPKPVGIEPKDKQPMEEHAQEVLNPDLSKKFEDIRPELAKISKLHLFQALRDHLSKLSKTIEEAETTNAQKLYKF